MMKTTLFCLGSPCCYFLIGRLYFVLGGHKKPPLSVGGAHKKRLAAIFHSKVDEMESFESHLVEHFLCLVE
jgi:hypothetical protein